MKRLKNILYFTGGSSEVTPALPREVRLTETNHARLTITDVLEPVETPGEVAMRFGVDFGISCASDAWRPFMDRQRHSRPRIR